jgi:hypothetical protein
MDLFLNTVRIILRIGLFVEKKIVFISLLELDRD